MKENEKIMNPTNLLKTLAFLALFSALSLLGACSGDDDDTNDNITPGDGDEIAQEEESEENELEELSDPVVQYFDFPEDHPLLTGKFVNIAHRGGGDLAPEETIPAFEKAKEVGADLFELDLHATSDGVVVLQHDSTVDRMTDGSGTIREMTFEKLRTFDAGYKFSPDGGETHPYRGQGVVIPTFKEVLEAFPEMFYTVEIKQANPSIVDSVIEILDETDMAEHVILVAFADITVQEVREKRPDIITGAPTGEMVTFSVLDDTTEADYVPPCPFFQVPDIEPNALARAHRFGIRVQVWTINDPDEMRALLDMGVDGIITDNPLVLSEIIAEREE